MAFDFASAKALVRQTVHETLGVPGLYQDHSMSVPEPIRVRWHSKIDRFGDLESSGYAEVIEGIDRVIFQATEARAVGVRSGGTVTIQALGGVQLTLGAQEPADGPYEEIWSASKL